MSDPVATWSEILTSGKEKEHIVRREEDEVVSFNIPKLNPVHDTGKILLTYLNYPLTE